MPKSYDCSKPPIGGEPRPDEVNAAVEAIRALLLNSQPDPRGGHRECYVVRLADQLSEAGHSSLASQWALYKMRQAELVLAMTRPCTVIDGSGRSIELPGEPSDNIVRATETLPGWVGPLVGSPEPPTPTLPAPAGDDGTDGEPDGPWSKPRFPKDWVTLLGLTARTFLRRRDDKTYHAKKEGQRVKILLSDLPEGMD